MVTVVKARSQLPSGMVLSASDLVLDRVVASDVPKGVLTNPNDLVGKTLAAPVAENQMMTLLTTTTARTSVPPGHVIAPLRLADSALTALLRPGDVVDVVAADPEGEQFWPGESRQLYDALRSPKILVPFTAAEGADLHCEPKNPGLRAQRMFDWLDTTLPGV